MPELDLDALPATGSTHLPPLLASEPGEITQAFLGLEGAKSEEHTGSNLKTTQRKLGTAPVACPGSDPLTGTGPPRPKQWSQSSCAKQKLTMIKIRWGWDREAWWVLRALDKGASWSDSPQCSWPLAVQPCTRSVLLGFSYLIWPQASPEGNMQSPWDTWPRGHKEKPCTSTHVMSFLSISS